MSLVAGKQQYEMDFYFHMNGFIGCLKNDYYQLQDWQ